MSVKTEHIVITRNTLIENAIIRRELDSQPNESSNDVDDLGKSVRIECRSENIENGGEGKSIHKLEESNETLHIKKDWKPCKSGKAVI